ncbi:hypothetical protein MTP02_27910 [Streptomyces albus]|nr:hypothetical protein MTP02_27910 [Streptomyces albus]
MRAARPGGEAPAPGMEEPGPSGTPGLPPGDPAGRNLCVDDRAPTSDGGPALAAPGCGRAARSGRTPRITTADRRTAPLVPGRVRAGPDGLWLTEVGGGPWRGNGVAVRATTPGPGSRLSTLSKRIVMQSKEHGGAKAVNG